MTRQELIHMAKHRVTEISRKTAQAPTGTETVIYVVKGNVSLKHVTSGWTDGHHAVHFGSAPLTPAQVAKELQRAEKYEILKHGKQDTPRDIANDPELPF